MIKEKNELPLILDAYQVAKILNCSYCTALRIFETPDFPDLKLGKKMKRVGREAFFKWLDKNLLEGAK
jgi:hypothetical protein